VRLSAETEDRLPGTVERPSYDRREQAVGIVHFGVGAFHRAHQAVYTDTAMGAGDRDWSIAGVSLRSANVRESLAPQDGLYTLTEHRGERQSTRLVGAVDGVLAGKEQADQIVARVADGQTRILSFTVSEKGYHRDSSGALDSSAPSIEGDLAGIAPSTIYGFLQAGLSRRRAEGHGGLTLLSCDNLPENGSVLRKLLLDFTNRSDPGLGRWIDEECAFPSTMVDRIVPATTPAQVDELESRISLRDEAAVFTEPFSQWVIEERFAAGRPRWEEGGAEFVTDVRLHESAKLRMLNGAHSALAYLGLERGHEFVHEAIADPDLRPVIETILKSEAPSTLGPGLNTGAYADRLLARFANEALRHRLAQIAIDGSQKIPQRWLAVLDYHQHEGRSCPALIEALAAWLRHIRGEDGPVDDPLATTFQTLWESQGQSGIVAALFGDKGLFADAWIASERNQQALSEALEMENSR